MQNYATVGPHRIPLSSLDTIRVVATLHGFDDVDCEPTVSGVQVTASGKGKKAVVVKGDTLIEVCDRFVVRLMG